MRYPLIVAVLGIIIAAPGAKAEPVADAIPMGASHFVCTVDSDQEPDRGHFGFTIVGDTLITDQTGDVHRILKNNKYGIVATSAESEFVPRLNKTMVTFFSIAIERKTGKAVTASGSVGQIGLDSSYRETCTAL